MSWDFGTLFSCLVYVVVAQVSVASICIGVNVPAPPDQRQWLPVIYCWNVEAFSLTSVVVLLIWKLSAYCLVHWFLYIYPWCLPPVWGHPLHLHLFPWKKLPLVAWGDHDYPEMGHLFDVKARLWACDVTRIACITRTMPSSGIACMLHGDIRGPVLRASLILLTSNRKWSSLSRVRRSVGKLAVMSVPVRESRALVPGRILTGDSRDVAFSDTAMLSVFL